MTHFGPVSALAVADTLKELWADAAHTLHTRRAIAAFYTTVRCSLPHTHSLAYTHIHSLTRSLILLADMQWVRDQYARDFGTKVVAHTEALMEALVSENMKSEAERLFLALAEVGC